MVFYNSVACASADRNGLLKIFVTVRTSEHPSHLHCIPCKENSLLADLASATGRVSRGTTARRAPKTCKTFTSSWIYWQRAHYASVSTKPFLCADQVAPVSCNT